MPTYFAIARRNGNWVYICSSPHPEDAYREAITIIEARETYSDDEFTAYSPAAESMLDTLRVVPEETAKEHYNVTFHRQVMVDE